MLGLCAFFSLSSQFKFIECFIPIAVKECLVLFQKVTHFHSFTLVQAEIYLVTSAWIVSDTNPPRSLLAGALKPLFTFGEVTAVMKVGKIDACLSNRGFSFW